jgi:general nucleoside transport system ATP-binding protein
MTFGSPALERRDLAPAVSMRQITKRFGATLAVDAVDFEVTPGTVHALLGENGAGKSTLMNCLFGLVKCNEGEIWLLGDRVEISSPRDALDLGVGMVHQHFKLAPTLTVAENVFLGREKVRLGLVRKAESEADVAAIAEKYGLGVSPGQLVRNLSVGAQQRVEILRALSQNVRTLVLDEPTAVLTPLETDRFFEVVRGLAARGLAVVLISHHLDEVLKVADQVTVLRRGRRVAHRSIKDVDARVLADLIVGEHHDELSAVPLASPGATVLSVADLSVKNRFGKTVVDDVTFDVKRGEIVGFLGIAGNGQTELVEAITGLRRPSAGHASLGETRTGGPNTVAAFRNAGMGHIPEDRIGRGMCGLWSVEDNIAVGFLNSGRIGKYIVSRKAKDELVGGLLKRFDVRVASPQLLARRLSGGNAQKLVLSRELSQDPKVIVCAEPTRGLDLAATDFVRRQLVARRDAGAAVLLVSSEIREVLAIADRALVILNGRIVAQFTGRASESDVGRAMLGDVE